MIVTSETTVAELADFDGPAIEIHSAGGGAFDHFAMADIVRRKGLAVHVVGIACGGAVLLLSASERATAIPTASISFIEHWCFMSGTTSELSRSADLLRTLDTRFASFVANSAADHVTEETVLEWMRDGCWFSAEQAHHHGLVHVQEESPCYPPRSS